MDRKVNKAVMMVETSSRKCMVTILMMLTMLLPVLTFANIKLPRLISDGMVLQRNQNIKVWGWADDGEQVNLNFNGMIVTAVADTDGKWEFVLPPMAAGGPYVMVVKGKNTLILKDILIGDVWLCSGQSNMEFDLDRVKDKYAYEIAASTNSEIRQFLVNRSWSFKVTADVVSDGWKSADPETVLKFTAVGYFFAKALYKRLHVPIGLINSCVGGTPAEAWTSTTGLKEFPYYLDEADLFKDDLRIKQLTTRNKLLSDAWYARVQSNDKGYTGTGDFFGAVNYNTESWKSMNVPGFWETQGLKNVDGVIWFRKEVNIPVSLAGKRAVLYLGTLLDQDTTYLNGHKIGSVNSKHLPRKYLVDTLLLKPGKNIITVRILNLQGSGGFLPDKPYKLVIGEHEIGLTGAWQYRIGYVSMPFPSDSITRFNYKPTSLFNSMIAPLVDYAIKGVVWYQGEANTTRAKEYARLFPAMITDWRNKWRQGNFPFLFVQLPGFKMPFSEPAESDWAELREAQLKALSLPNTGMAVTIDIGEWNDVHPLNKLDVGERLALAARKVAYRENEIVYSGPVYKSMKIKGKKIILSFSNVGGGLMPGGGAGLAHFAIAGNDKKFVWATASIQDSTVTVWNEKIMHPVAVRYAWANNPQGANLFNREGLPASPFRTDDWSAIIKEKY